MKFISIFLTTLAGIIAVGFLFVRISWNAMSVEGQVRKWLQSSSSLQIEHRAVQVSWRWPCMLEIEIKHPLIRLTEDQHPLFEAEKIGIPLSLSDLFFQRIHSSHIQLLQAVFYMTEDRDVNWAHVAARLNLKSAMTLKRKSRQPSKEGQWTWDISQWKAGEPTLKIGRHTLVVHTLELNHLSNTSWQLTLKGALQDQLTYELEALIQPNSFQYTARLGDAEVKITGEGTIQNGNINYGGEVEFKDSNLEHLKNFIPGWRGAGTLSGSIVFEAQNRIQSGSSDSIHLEGLLELRHCMLGPAEWTSDFLKQTLSVRNSNRASDSPEKLLKEMAHRPFDVIQLELSLQNGVLDIRNMRIKHPDYYFEGNGEVECRSGNAEVKAKIVFLERYANEIVHVAPEMEALRTANGRLALPVIYRGRWRDVPGWTALQRNSLSMQSKSMQSNEPI